MTDRGRPSVFTYIVFIRSRDGMMERWQCGHDTGLEERDWVEVAGPESSGLEK